MNRNFYKFIIPIFSIILLLLNTIAQSISPQKANIQQNDEWCTIFVHGSVGSSLYFKYFFTLFKEDVQDTSYYQLTKKHRNNPKWCKNHAAQALGLHKIDTTSQDNKTAAQLFAILYNYVQNKFFPHEYCNNFYTFGWSGIVNHKQRCNDAAIFYKELKALVKRLKTTNPYIKIRIVAYSHGGNVVLNMAQEHDNDPQAADFVIDEVVLIATPIQCETDCYSLHPFFKRIYNIYSRADCVQKKDCFSKIRFFSGRKFRDNKRCPCSTATQQIELKISMAANKDLKAGQMTNATKRINRSPGHIELWYFANLCACECNGMETYEPCFESKLYRAHFPLEPLPAAILAPGLIALAQHHASSFPDIVIDVQPDTGKAVLRETSSSYKQIIDFIAPETFDTMRDIAFPYLQKRESS